MKSLLPSECGKPENPLLVNVSHSQIRSCQVRSVGGLSISAVSGVSQYHSLLATTEAVLA